MTTACVNKGQQFLQFMSRWQHKLNCTHNQHLLERVIIIGFGSMGEHDSFVLFDYASAKLCVPVAGLKCTDTGVLSCDASDKSFHDQVATLEAAITFLQQLLPGRSMTRGTACNPPETLRALSMERSKSGKLLNEGKTGCSFVQITYMCVQCMAA